jgi:hypothetical protein
MPAEPLLPCADPAAPVSLLWLGIEPLCPEVLPEPEVPLWP